MVEKLIKLRKVFGLKKITRILLIILGIDLPNKVQLGKNIEFPHNSIGTVIHPNTIIKDNVKIYQNVTIGRADINKSFEESKMKRIIIEEGAILCAGAKILSKEEELIVGKNTIVAANAVLLQSTGDNEVWGGIPARKLK